MVEPDVEESRGFGHLCWDKHTRNVCKSCVCTWTLKGVRERDLFGAHAYERTNRLAAYHTEWTKLAKLQGWAIRALRLFHNSHALFVSLISSLKNESFVLPFKAYKTMTKQTNCLSLLLRQALIRNAVSISAISAVWNVPLTFYSSVDEYLLIEMALISRSTHKTLEHQTYWSIRYRAHHCFRQQNFVLGNSLFFFAKVGNIIKI